MFDIGWTELLVIGIVALIVVGPKDLPGMFRTLGRFTAKAKSMAREFSRAMEDAADEAGVKDVAKDIKGMTSAKNLGLDTIKDAAGKFEKWDPTKPGSKSAKGPATEALSQERAEAARKIRQTSTKGTGQKAGTQKAGTQKAGTQKAGTQKAGAGKPAAKPAAKPTSGKAGKKPAARKTAAKSGKKAST